MNRFLMVLALVGGVTSLAGLATSFDGQWVRANELKGQKKVATSDQNVTPELEAGLAGALSFPANIGGTFDLVDQNETRRTLADFAGKPLAIFFGYAKCEAICSVAIPRMVEMVDLLSEKKIDVQPVLITVDPKRDTPAAMREALPSYHANLIGLTGTRSQIDDAQKAFQVESKVVYVDPDGGEIFAHGSYIYLMGADGKFLTLFPPIIGPERMAKVAEKYLTLPRS